METKTETTALVARPSEGLPISRVVGNSVDAIKAIDQLGEWFAKSGMFGADRKEAGTIIALTCMTEGLTPVEFSRTYDIVFGKLRKKSMAAFAEFRRAGGRVKWLQTGEDGKRASAEFTFEGQTVTLSYSIEEAAKAGLTKKESGWDKNPANMLRARVISNALGMLCPEIYAGEYDDAPAGPSLNLSPEKPAAVTEVATAAAPAPQPAAAPKREAAPPTIEAKVEVVTGTKAAPATASPLPDALQFSLMDVIGNDPANLVKATQFCRAQKWIGPDDGMEHLPEGRAREIIARRDHFRKKVLGIGGGQ